MQAITLPATLLKWDPNTGARAIIYYHVTKQFLPCLLELIDNIFHSMSRRKFIYCTSTSGFIYNKNSICWWWWWWIVFVVWLTDERRLALFPAETIVRDPHHRESLTRRGQGFWTCAEPEFRLSWMKLCNRDNHYTTASNFVIILKPF